MKSKVVVLISFVEVVSFCCVVIEVGSGGNALRSKLVADGVRTKEDSTKLL